MDGLLKKGQAQKKPPTITPVPQPWEAGYNPREHSVAVRMGGEYIRPGRYRLKHNGLIVDDQGMLVDQDACMECGTLRGPDGKVVGADWRWQVRTTNPDPYAPRWKHAVTYCHTCVTSQELQSHKQWLDRERMKAEAEAMRNNGRR